MTSSVLVLGVFDGVHRGHQALINQARLRADLIGADVGAVTFDPHPAAVLAPSRAPALLSGLERRIELLHAAGCDAVHVQEFTAQFAQKSPSEFVDEVLMPLTPVEVIVGENFRFGHRAAGDARALAELGSERGFLVHAEPLRTDELMVVSSTRVRSLVLAGDVDDAAQLLGRPHRLDGVVVHGDHRGRELGYPTANLEWSASAAVPADGVYAGYLVVDPGLGEQRHLAAISVGTNPHFGGVSRRVEAYAIDVPADFSIYGQPVAVEFAIR
ncbi:MAG: hypothetical protein RL745_1021, partial [Actinomycetota bacterium]